MERLKIKIVELLLKKYALGYLVKGWGYLKGYKTQIFAVLSLLAYGLKVTGQISDDLGDQLIAAFGSGASFAFIQKLQRYEPEIKGLVNEVNSETK